MKPAISVIIPVYNTAEYVSEAIDSVLGQTQKDIEIIAVDDCSTDGSADVLRGYGDRIKVISHPQNTGQATSRNDGLEHANGEFVLFLDSDDYIEADMLERCVNLCRKDNLDFVFFDAVSFGGDSLVGPWFDYHRSASYQKVDSGCSVINDMLAKGIYRCSICMVLYRMDFIRKTGLRFPDGILHEDEYFSAVAYLSAQRVEGIAEEFYHRRLRHGSTMGKPFSMRNVAGYLKVLELLGKLDTNSLQRKAVRSLSAGFVKALVHNGWQLPLGMRLRIAALSLRYPQTLSLCDLVSMLVKKYL